MKNRSNTEIHRGMMTNEHITVGSNSYEQVKAFKLGSLMTSQKSIHEVMKFRIKAVNSCYYRVQTRLFSRLLSKKLKIKIYKAIALPVLCIILHYNVYYFHFNLQETC